MQNQMPINWFDAVVVITLLVGLNTGRKHGMSEELMATVQWVVIIFAGAFLYRPIGDALARSSPVSHLFCYIAIYVTAAILTKLAFSLLKKAMGGKLIGSDVFGAGEYYLGMIAGAVRYSCILMAVLAVMNAPHYSEREINAAKAYQNEAFGSEFFPEFSTVQKQIFSESLVGSLIKQRASVMLIASTRPEQVGVKRAKDELP
jgi:uncharacterized membrane protein required for colicin V production